MTVVVLAAIFAAIPLAHGFIYDDRPIVLLDDRVHSLARAWRLFGESYWPASGGEALYRPFTMLGFAIQWAIGRGAPVVFHLANLLLYAALTLAVYRLLESVAPRTAAAIGAAFFAIHPVHTEAVAGVVGQAELWVALACVLAVTRYIRLRAAGSPPTARDAAFIAGCYAVACFAKENGAVLPALLAIAHLTVRSPKSGTREWTRGSVSLLSSLAGVLIVWLFARGAVLGWRAGDLPNVALEHASLTTRVWTMLGVSREWLRLLVWPARLVADHAPREIVILDMPVPDAWLGLAGMLGAIAIAALTWTRNRAVALGVSWTAIGLAPVSNILVVTGVLLAERTLLLPSVGAIIVLACAVTWLEAHVPARAIVVHRAVLAVLLLAGLGRSLLRMREWRDNRTLFASSVRDAPASYRAHYTYGGALFDAGDKRAGERELRTALLIYPYDPQVHTDLGSTYLKSQLYAPAEKEFRDALALDSRQSAARVGLITCLLQRAEFDSASAHARTGLATGLLRSTFARLLEISDSVATVRASASADSATLLRGKR